MACGCRKLLAERTGARPIGEIIGLSSQYMFRSQPNSVEYPCEKTDSTTDEVRHCGRYRLCYRLGYPQPIGWHIPHAQRAGCHHLFHHLADFQLSGEHEIRIQAS